MKQAKQVPDERKQANHVPDERKQVPGERKQAKQVPAPIRTVPCAIGVDINVSLVGSSSDLSLRLSPLTAAVEYTHTHAHMHAPHS